MPLRRDIRTTCTCPDDDNWDGYACKHVVAAMFTLSDEFLLEPELLDVWRNRTTDTTVEPVCRGRVRTDRGDRVGGASTCDWSGRTRHDRGRTSIDEPRRSTPRTDPLEALLAVPAGATLPDVADIERIEPMMPKSRALATVLRDALSNLRIDWD